MSVPDGAAKLAKERHAKEHEGHRSERERRPGECALWESRLD